MSDVPRLENLAAAVDEMERSFADQVSTLRGLVGEAEAIEQLLRNRQLHLTRLEALVARSRELKDAVLVQRQLLKDVRQQLGVLRERISHSRRQ